MPVKRILFLLLLLKGASAAAQTNPSLIKAYRFGEGWRMKDSSGSLLRISGYLQPYAESKRLMGETGTDADVRFRLRRVRLRIDGNSANDKFSYRFQTDLSGTGELLDGSSNYLLDAWVAYEPARRIKISFGQRAPYTDNRELFMNSNTLQLVERSRLTSAFATIREFGLFVENTTRLSNQAYLRYYLTLTNGDGPNVFGPDRGGLKYGGRIDFLPFGLFSSQGQFNQVDIIRERTPKLVIGTTYSYAAGVSSRSGRESGAILYLDAQNQELLPDYAKFGVDFLFKYRGFSALGEYMQGNALVPGNITQRVRVDGSVSGDFIVNGEQNVPDYIKARMIVGSAWNLQMGYLFKNGISVDGRYTRLTPATHSFLNNGTFYNRPYYYTLGLSKYVGRHYGAKIQADLTLVQNRGGINNNQGLPVSGNEVIRRIQSTFTF
ncbi:MAG: hypothetical protein RL160_1788 [Bacteroidota bacterium]